MTHFLNLYVEKPFLALPPDWDMEEKMWKTGALFSYLQTGNCVKSKKIFEDDSGGMKHDHCMDTVLAKRRV